MYKKYMMLLEKTNKTSYKVSKDTGVSQTALSNWKNEKNNISLKNLIKLSKYFGVPVEYFLEEDVNV